MLASFGCPTPGDNVPLILAAAVIVLCFCRDTSRRLTIAGRIWLLLLTVAWVLND